MRHVINNHAIDVLLALCILSAIAGCNKPEVKPKPRTNPKVSLITKKFDDGKVAKIAVMSSGDMFLNEHKVSIDEVETEIEKLGDSIDEFWYHRESPNTDEPHPNAMKVIDILATKGLPIAFYWDREFTKRVKFDGK